MPAFRPHLQDARTLISKSLDFGFCHESGKTTMGKDEDGYDVPKAIKHPAPRITCSIVMKNHPGEIKPQKILCQGKGIDERSAFDEAIAKLNEVPNEVLEMNENEMAQEIVRLRRQQAEGAAAQFAKPTQNRGPLQVGAAPAPPPAPTMSPTPAAELPVPPADIPKRRGRPPKAPAGV